MGAVAIAAPLHLGQLPALTPDVSSVPVLPLAVLVENIRNVDAIDGLCPVFKVVPIVSPVSGLFDDHVGANVEAKYGLTWPS